MEGTGKMPSVGSLKIGGKHSKSFSTLMKTISETNDELWLCFRGLYVLYQADPCGNADYYQSEMRLLIEQRKRVRTATQMLAAIGLMIQQAPSDPSISTRLSEVAEMLGARASEVLAPLVIEKTQATARLMIEGAADV